MELPQPRLCEIEGREPTHDFLTVNNHSNVQQDPRPPSQGGYKTHDFFEPLDRVGKGSAEENMVASKKPPPALPITDQQVLLPGPYTISHVSYFNRTAPITLAQASSNERLPDENSICGSYAGSGFTLWEESVGKKGQTRKENAVQRSNTRGMKMGQLPSSERPSQSSTNNQTNSFSSFSSSQTSGQKSQSFMEMLRSAKGSTPDDELDDDEEVFIKKESSSNIQISDSRVKVYKKSSEIDQKTHSPRSKHSATEQRRRSKINDRFQTLRELIPNSEQKRDKASFLLEVTEYIKCLQEKLNKYEGSYQGWNNDAGKLLNWRSKKLLAENCLDQDRGVDGGAAPSAISDLKFDETYFPISQTLFANTESCMEQPGMANKSRMPFPLSPQPGSFSPVPSVNTFSGTSNPNVISLTTNQVQSCQDRPHGTDFVDCRDGLKEQQPGVEGGTICISSVYSHGLLKSLTQALESSGVDLSEARISVQIQLGKRRRNDTASSLASTIKENETVPNNQREKVTDRKKLKTDTN